MLSNLRSSRDRQLKVNNRHSGDNADNKNQQRRRPSKQPKGSRHHKLPQAREDSAANRVRADRFPEIRNALEETPEAN